MRRWIGFAAVFVVFATACGGTPDAVENRPVLESCNPGGEEIYLPAGQGPSEAEARSLAAIECILDAHESGQAREADFVLMGVEGDRHRLILQTLTDGTVNEYQKVGEWSIAEGCRNLQYDGVFFIVGGCAARGTDPEDLPATTTSGDRPDPVALPPEYPLAVPQGYVPVCAEDTIVNVDVRVRIVELAGFPEGIEEEIEALESLVDFYLGELAALGHRAEAVIADEEMPFSASVEASTVLGESFAVAIQQGVHGMGVTTVWARGLMAEGEVVPARPCDAGIEP